MKCVGSNILTLKKYTMLHDYCLWITFSVEYICLVVVHTQFEMSDDNVMDIECCNVLMLPFKPKESTFSHCVNGKDITFGFPKSLL